MWFTEIASVEEPGRTEIERFVDAVRNFLGFVLEVGELRFLWEGEPGLHSLAIDSFGGDVGPACARLRAAVRDIPDERLVEHGLIGRPMRFKLRVADAIGNQWERVRGQFSVREWFKRIVDAIDAILDSLINAAGGVGGLIKEFKDALRALV